MAPETQIFAFGKGVAMIIDFSKLPHKQDIYAGASGKKLSVSINGATYMIKFSPQATKTDLMSYTNSSISEHLGCQIFNLLGVEAQETILGIYTFRGKAQVVVACKDFTSPGINLRDFASLKNRVIDSSGEGYGTDLQDIEYVIDEQTLIDRDVLMDRFWDMFVIDAFIGNWDRHNGNWGFLYNSYEDSMSLAPVYDCGSSLFPQLDEATMLLVLKDKAEMHHRIFNVPTSAIRNEGRRINYYEFISSLNHGECNRALERIVPRMNMTAIGNIIEETPLISDIQKEFFWAILSARKERIHEYSLRKLNRLRNQYEGRER